MSKELRALNRIKDFMSVNAVHWKQDIGMIETALKRLEVYDMVEKLPMPKVEVLDNNKIGYVGHDIVITNKEQFNKDQKKLKALDIIKKCCILKPSYRKNSIMAILCSSDATEEEYELLKEVLL